MAIEIGQIVKNLIPTEPVTINQIQPLGTMVSIKFTGAAVSNRSTRNSRWPSAVLLTHESGLTP